MLFWQSIADFQKQKSHRQKKKEDKENLEKQIQEWSDWIHVHNKRIADINVKIDELEKVIGNDGKILLSSTDHVILQSRVHGVFSIVKYP